MILSTNQRRGCVARISRDPFRRLVLFSVPQRRSPENEAKTGTAKSGSRPLLAVETRPDPHLCDPIRSAPCSGNAPIMSRFHCRLRNRSVRKGAVGRGRYSPAQFRGRVSTADSTLYGRPDVDRRGSYVNIVNNVFLPKNADERLHLLVRPSKRLTRHVHCKE